jgi:XTP/dITP diphosphohydrolase
MNDPIRVYLGTRNAKKLRELAQLINPPWEPNDRLGRLDVHSLDAYPDLPDVVEDAPTFAGNAAKKASEVARALNAWVLADDSGLAVDALDGAPGVMSARYAGNHGDDGANNLKLLADLADIPEPRRGAAFICALALADPGGVIRLEAEGACRGRIIREGNGDGGFGYDPLFLIPEYHKTFAQMGALAKHQLSHRARAFSKLRPMLDRLIATGAMDTPA